MRPPLLLAFLLLSLPMVPCVASAQPPTRTIVGWTEKVWLTQDKIVLNAKLDSGADYSSLDATNIEEFTRDEKTWVRFTVTDRLGKQHVLEQRLVRTALIKRHGGKYQKREVVRLGICLGDIYLKSDVNLIDRSNFKLQMLVGRNFLAGNAIIDPAVTFTQEPRCKKE